MTKRQIELECESISNKAKILSFHMTQEELSSELNIAINTLKSRIKNNNWTYKEALTLKHLAKNANV